MDEATREYREKHKRCSYCVRRRVAACGSSWCTISGKFCTPNLKAIWCKNYEVGFGQSGPAERENYAK